jgi:hypothetical protein
MDERRALEDSRRGQRDLWTGRERMNHDEATALRAADRKTPGVMRKILTSKAHNVQRIRLHDAFCNGRGAWQGRRVDRAAHDTRRRRRRWTDRYTRMAVTLADLNYEPFPDVISPSPQPRPETAPTARNQRECEGGDLNPEALSGASTSSSNLAIEGTQERGITSGEAMGSVLLDAPRTPVANAVANAVDAVESALSDAVTKAATAGRFDVVAQLARELEARRLGRMGNVVALLARTRKQIE